MASYDVVWTIGWTVAVVLALAALVSLGRARSALGRFGTAVWCVAVLLLPVVGALAWFVVRGAGSGRGVGSARRVESVRGAD